MLLFYIETLVASQQNRPSRFGHGQGGIIVSVLSTRIIFISTTLEYLFHYAQMYDRIENTYRKQKDQYCTANDLGVEGSLLKGGWVTTILC